MAVNYCNEIISVFLERNVNELGGDDLNTAIETKGWSCSPEKIRRIVQSFPSLFQLQYNNEGRFLIRIELTINICQDFLAGKCSFKTGGCNQLHLCRSFGHCARKDCRFAHDFTRGNNRRIIEQSNCQNVDPLLIVRLIRFNKRFAKRSYKTPATPSVVSKTTDMLSSSVQPKHIHRVFERSNRTRSRRPSRGHVLGGVNDRDNLIQSPSALDDNSRVNISFPTTSISFDVTIEMIETFLRHQGWSVEKRLNLKTNENFHQWTLRPQENSLINDLLKTSVIPYNGILLKFKRTKPIIDSQSFVLKSTIDAKRGPITIEKFSAYIDQLIDRNPYKLIDLSIPFEQVLLIQCENIIDFNRLDRIQRSRRQLQGVDVSLKRVYELDKVFVESILTPLSSHVVENIIESVRENVFTFTVVSKQTALVEFIHTDALKQWLAVSDITKHKFGVDIRPNLEYVDEDKSGNTCRHSFAAQSVQQKAINATSQVSINLRRSWAIVVNHLTFSVEFKNYIRSELGFEINIHEDRVEMQGGSMSDTLAKENSTTALNSRINNFMDRFAFRSIGLRQSVEQLDILRAHSTTVAFCCTKGNNFLIATKKSNIEPLMYKLLSKQPIDKLSSVASAAYETIKSTDQKQLTTFVIPPPLSNSASSTDEKPSTSDEIITTSTMLPINTSAQMALFADKTFENRLQIYFNKVYNTKLSIEVKIDSNTRRVVKVVGRQSSVCQTLNELLNLISLFRTKTFNDKTDSGWINLSNAVHVIQHQFNRRNIICVCQQQTSPVSILVHYIGPEHNTFGVSEHVIDTMCQKNLITAICTSVRADNEWTSLKTKILERGDYGKDICLFDKQQTIILYGVVDLVKDVQQQFESLNKKNEKINDASTIVDIKPTKLSPVADQREKSVENLPQPSESTMRKQYTQMNTDVAQPRSITFCVDEPGFEVLINQDPKQLLAVIESKCSLQKQIIHHQIQIQIPQAKVDQLDDNTSEAPAHEKGLEPPKDLTEVSTTSKQNWLSKLFTRNKPKTTFPQSTQQQSPTPQVRSTSNANNISCVSVGNSKIIVCTGDLTKQVVDIIVVCSTSALLCDAITSAAGQQVQKLYNQQSSCSTLVFETTGGNLPCKQIVFRPWNHDKNQLQDLKQSVDKFVASVITHALQHNFTTIAFPSIGCGRLGHDPKLIAEYMIGETHRQLKTAVASHLIVSFVLLSEQQNVYDAFADQLNKIQSFKAVITSISFDKQTVKITLTGLNDSELNECQNKIKQLAQSYTFKLNLINKIDIADWSQESIEKYYNYCLQRRVIPTLDIQNAIVDLIGPKEAVSEAEKYCLQLTNETLRNARIQVLSRGFVWLVEVPPGKWNQYSYRINDQIEDAQSKNLSYVEFMNENSERCRVIFSSMQEQYQTRKRKVCRKRIDSSFPNYWDLSGGNFRRVVLLNSSKEYKDTCEQFDKTMKGVYWKIVKIERIQNERWYKQYTAHRDEFTQRYGQSHEQLLFHGCSSTSADKIVQECFNRAFAGVNGVVYGCGVYFHEHARYSSSYTRPDVSGERTMFLARVLIGKTCIGTPSMKVPPAGFNTTTDGQHIFVVYHDAGAYGEYLITYR